jgi:glutaredoxin
MDRNVDNKVIILGADWCTGCKTIKKKLKEKNIRYKYVCIPPGQAGWDMVEALTGRRAIPQVFYHFGTLKSFNEALIGEL